MPSNNQESLRFKLNAKPHSALFCTRNNVVNAEFGISATRA